MNQKLTAIKFKSSAKEHPPVQGRFGQVSIADYSNGYCFGAKICGYFDYFQKKPDNPEKVGGFVRGSLEKIRRRDLYSARSSLISYPPEAGLRCSFPRPATPKGLKGFPILSLAGFGQGAQ